LVLSWVQVQTDTFVVKSAAGEERAKRVVRELEAFRQLIGTALVFKKVQLPELPIEVLIVSDEALLTELSPEYNGKKVRVAGYYERGQDRDFIVLSANTHGNLTHIVYHELTHYFLSRSLQPRPAWLNEGLAEYFATVDIDDDAAYVGGLSQERLQLLRTEKLLPLKDFFAVDDRSPYYNETAKANVFYAQAWAFVHFLTHGPYKNEFHSYLSDLARHEVKFSDYVKTDLTGLEIEFDTYLKLRMRTVVREKLRISSEGWTMTTRPIQDADVELAIAEVFLSGGRLDDARKHLEKVAGIDDEFPRASYYRGVLARITGEGNPREYFVDALMDPNLGPRAAVHLVQLHELGIPAVRRALEQAAANATHMADVYWALTEIYLDDARRTLETIQLTKNAAQPEPVTPSKEPIVATPEPVFTRYSEGEGDHFQFELLCESGTGPKAVDVHAPFFPEELLKERLRGRVVVDVVISDTGEVSGLFLISSVPEIFSVLATSAVRDWKFEPIAGKVRVVLQFIP
jgi:hypothetical protein